MKESKKIEKKLNAFWVIVQALFALFIGVFILNKEAMFLNVFEYIVAIYFFVMGIIELLKNLILKKNRKIRITGILLGLLNISVSIYIAKNSGYVLPAFSIVFTTYIVLVAIVKTIVLGIYVKNRISGRIITLVQVILSYYFAILLCFKPAFRNDLTIIIAGIYFIMLSITYILDGVEILMPIKYMKILRRRVRVVNPVFIASFIPKTSLKKIENTVIEENNKETLENVDNNETADMEILIYIKNRGKEIFGHADIFFDGKIYSYGPYDKSTNVIQNLIGDGVLLETEERQKYIDISMRYSSMTVVSFGIKLTDDQKQAVKNTIEDIKKDVYSWSCNAENGVKSRDYASVVYRRTDAKFFKFKQGKFRKYFSFNTNCVLFLDRIIGSLGIDIVRFTGIITPGTYYDYFNRQYKLQNSNVIFKKVYKRDRKVKI